MGNRLPITGAIWALLLMTLTAQIAIARHLAPLRAGIEEIPFPLGATALSASALGDQQFLFRSLARWLQGVGDGDGRVRPLIDYDYERVIAWLWSLDTLDPHSRAVSELALRYFGSVVEPNKGPPRVRQIMLFCIARAERNPAAFWKDLVWAVSQDLRVVKDREIADRLAADILAWRGLRDVPYWLPLLAASLYQFSGNQEGLVALQSDPDWVAIRNRNLQDLRHAGSTGKPLDELR